MRRETAGRNMIGSVGLESWRALTLRCRRVCAQVHMLARGMPAIHTLQSSFSSRIGTAVTGLALPSQNTPRVCTHGDDELSAHATAKLTGKVPQYWRKGRSLAANVASAQLSVALQERRTQLNLVTCFLMSIPDLTQRKYFIPLLFQFCTKIN